MYICTCLLLQYCRDLLLAYSNPCTRVHRTERFAQVPQTVDRIIARIFLHLTLLGFNAIAGHKQEHRRKRAGSECTNGIVLKLDEVAEHRHGGTEHTTPGSCGGGVL